MNQASTIENVLSGILKSGLGACRIGGSKADPPEGVLNPGRPRLMLTLDGCRNYLIENNGMPAEIALRRGETLFAGTSCWHKSINREINTVISLIGDPQYLLIGIKTDSPESFLHSTNLFQRHESVNHPIHHILRALDGITESRKDCTVPLNNLVSAAFHLALAELRKPDETNIGKALRTYREVSNYLAENFHHDINRESVAKEFNLHPSHLSRLFKEKAGENFSDHLTRLRLESALILLKGGKLSVKEIAAECGFGDANYFGKVFRKYYRRSPTNYQK